MCNFFKQIGKTIMSYAASTILTLMGWQPLEGVAKMNRYNYVICVFSHTSYCDFLLMVLYKLAYCEELKNLKTLIRPDYFQTLGPFLRAVGGIPATMIKDRNGGAVDRIVSTLRKEKRVQFLISPKGTIMQGDWRSGYYHIAQQLQANLVAIGMDYDSKRVFVGQIISYKLPETSIKNLLYEDLGKIVPKFPEREMMTIRKHDTNNVHLVHPYRVCVIIGVIGICGLKLIMR